MEEKERIIPEMKQILEQTTLLVSTLQEIATDIKTIVEKLVPKGKEKNEYY